MTEATLADALARCAVATQARLRRGGSLALLMSVDNAAQLVALAMGEEPQPKDALDKSDLATLAEIVGIGLAEGVNRLMEAVGQETEGIEEAESYMAATSGEDLLSFLGEGAVMASFQLVSPPTLDGQAWLLFSRDLEELVQEGSRTVPAASEGSATLSEAEMNDILSGFSPAEPVPPEPFPPRVGMPSAHPLPSEVERVLDIKLVATARLGRVEMPISDILALGPGSIVEVGHLIDEPIELLVNDKLIARGDVVVVDEKFGLRITEIVSPAQRIESLR
ncbi:MAG TPA: FliM/FliN family flagellar motor switch protein [Candidatus Hydrogenedentes bacterium]|nr:FliM/FliN family flagellar motor switch protein [Candidatus Hydrogenedentota bacterium]HPG66266.1 FliM/FliN family flagellar motor switch protein [Candidatus Hydrogenedentota bacterium]